MSDEPYETGACPGCGRQVEFDLLDASQPGGPPTKVRGRWQCRTHRCRFGVATMDDDGDGER